MVGVSTTKVSSRGQVVIPQEIRKAMHLKEGAPLLVYRERDMVIFKKIQTPSRAELVKRLKARAKWGEAYTRKLGIKESDVPKLIHRGRGLKDD